MPDLREFWQHGFDERRTHRVDLVNQAIKVLDGTYLIYYTLFDELPRNRGVSTLISEEIASSMARGEMFVQRLFWRGDIFLVRFCDDWKNSSNAGDLEDVSDNLIPLLELLKKILGHIWQEQNLERAVDEDREHGWFSEQHDIDREMVLSKMFAFTLWKNALICRDPAVREELMKTPFGKATLEYLTITEGRLMGIKPESIKIEPCPDDPGMMRISFQPNSNGIREFEF